MTVQFNPATKPPVPNRFSPGHKFVVTEPPATYEETAEPPPPLSLPPPQSGEVTPFRSLRQRSMISIENIQDFYLSWSAQPLAEPDCPRLVNNPADLAKELLKQMKDICDSA